MAIDALKIQADMAEEDAPFDVSPLGGRAQSSGQKDQNHPLSAAISLDDWIKDNELKESETITLLMVVQLRDPLRRYEPVGAPVIVLIHATPAETKQGKYEQTKFRVVSLHVAGMKVQTGQKRNAWDTEKHRLTAMQWLIAYNMGKAAKKKKISKLKGGRSVMEPFIKDSCRYVAQVDKKSRCEIHKLTVAFCTSIYSKTLVSILIIFRARKMLPIPPTANIF